MAKSMTHRYIPRVEQPQPNLFMEEYYSSTDTKIYIDDEQQQEIAYISYSLQEQLKPLYGYNSRTFDDIAVGSRIVTGTLKVHLNNPEQQTPLSVIEDHQYNEDNIVDFIEDFNQEEVSDMNNIGWIRPQYDKTDNQDTDILLKPTSSSVSQSVYQHVYGDSSVNDYVYDSSVNDYVYDSSVNDYVYDSSIGDYVYDSPVGDLVYNSSVNQHVYNNYRYSLMDKLSVLGYATKVNNIANLSDTIKEFQKNNNQEANGIPTKQTVDLINSLYNKHILKNGSDSIIISSDVELYKSASWGADKIKSLTIQNDTKVKVIDGRFKDSGWLGVSIDNQDGNIVGYIYVGIGDDK